MQNDLQPFLDYRAQLVEAIWNNKCDEDNKLLFEEYGRVFRIIITDKITSSIYVNDLEKELNELYKRFNSERPYLFIPRFLIAKARNNYKVVKELFEEYNSAIISDDFDRILVFKIMAETEIDAGNLDKAEELIKRANKLSTNKKLLEILKLPLLKIHKGRGNTQVIEKICNKLIRSHVKKTFVSCMILNECAINFLYIGKYDKCEQIVTENLNYLSQISQEIKVIQEIKRTLEIQYKVYIKQGHYSKAKIPFLQLPSPLYELCSINNEYIYKESNLKDSFVFLLQNEHVQFSKMCNGDTGNTFDYDRV